MSLDDRAHLSIGEVLNLLQDDFPDITISKIRFLESQGLLDPERTPSGYRKFYDADIVRLRWILQQQKEHFLPLKVIKDRLEEEAAAAADAAATPFDSDITLHGVPVPLGADGVGNDGVDPAVAAEMPDRDTEAGSEADADAEAGPAPAPDSAPIEEHHSVTDEPSAPDPSAPAAPAASGADNRRPHPVFTAGDTSVSLGVEDLVRATGLTARQIGELERFGLIESDQLGTANRYDEEALVVARVAASMLQLGVEVRHLRMFKLAAEREAAFYEQLVTPVMKQRSPKARQDALDTLRELAEGGDALRSSMLRAALRHLVTR